MNAQKMAFFIFAFVVSAGIINGSGIFEQTVASPDVEIPGTDFGDGIAEANTGSASDLSASFDGWQMVSEMVSVVKTMLSVLLLPGPFLISMGVPVAFGIGLQCMASLSLVWSLVQIWTNRNTKGMD